MLAQFQFRYPTGSLVSKLLQIYQGKFVVQVEVRIKGITRAMGLAADENLELAEDRARNRALVVLLTESSLSTQSGLSSSHFTPISQLQPKFKVFAPQEESSQISMMLLDNGVQSKIEQTEPNLNFFEAIKSVDDIADALGCELSLITTVQQNPSSFYEEIHLPKKSQNKEYRIVFQANPPLDNLQKNIATEINLIAQFPEYVQGYVSKRSITTNASLHLGKKYVLKLDISNFFDSIKIEQVSAVFKSLGCERSLAHIFACLCTLNNHLIQGASTSPVLANLVCAELDRTLAEMGKQYGASYSRYADDITFSGEKVPNRKEIEKSLNRCGFEINPNKWKLQRRGKSQYVTGLTVFDDSIPRIAKSTKKELRQIIHYASKYGLENHLKRMGHSPREYAEICRIDGWIAFMYSVEPERAFRLDVEWQKILEKAFIPTTRDPLAVFRRHFSGKPQ